ncbi:hypothetical protein [Ammoniphilus sp. 3BR4]|uniref:hypothetical protein n=1 Tax=Ammoniphilus sp. 3BR4 TaxID=3158265 RepID=UPI0034652924
MATVGIISLVSMLVLWIQFYFYFFEEHVIELRIAGIFVSLIYLVGGVVAFKKPLISSIVFACGSQFCLLMVALNVKYQVLLLWGLLLLGLAIASYLSILSKKDR